MTTDKFVSRHNGPREQEVKAMLKKIGVSSVDELINQTVPDKIRLKQPLRIEASLSEYQYSKHLKELGKKNKLEMTIFILRTTSSHVIGQNIVRKYS